MKVFINRNLLDLDGVAVKSIPNHANEPVNQEREDEKLGVMLVEGLLRDLEEDKGMGGGPKFMRWKLAEKIKKAMKAHKEPTYSMDMSTEDVNMIKGRLGKFLPTVLIGPVYEAIDPTTNHEADEAENVKSIKKS